MAVVTVLREAVVVTMLFANPGALGPVCSLVCWGYKEAVTASPSTPSEESAWQELEGDGWHMRVPRDWSARWTPDGGVQCSAGLYSATLTRVSSPAGDVAAIEARLPGARRATLDLHDEAVPFGVVASPPVVRGAIAVRRDDRLFVLECSSPSNGDQLSGVCLEVLRSLRVR